MSGDQGERVDFFVSHAGPDRAWAIWIDAQLREAGYTTITDVYDFKAGQNFVLRMNDALGRADRVLLLMSPAAVNRPMVEAEWTAAFAAHPEKVVIVVVEEFELPPILHPYIHIDVAQHGADGAAAVEALRTGLRPPDRPESSDEVDFPGGAKPVRLASGFPKRDTLIFSDLIPPQDPFFTGRTEQLDSLASGLSGDRAMALVAAEGMGGAGKSALAIEHCWRSRATADVVWWVRAEEPEVGYADMAALGAALGLPPGDGSLEEQARAVRSQLSQLDQRWLLIVDNVEDAAVLDVVRPPGGNGQVVITARRLPAGVKIESVSVDTFTDEEAAAFLERRLPDYPTENRAALANRLGHLALALEQAAAYLIDTGSTIASYIEMLENEGLGAGDALAQDPKRTVTSVFHASMARATAIDRDASGLMQVLSLLAPELVPRTMFDQTAARQALGIETTASVNSAIAVLARLGLINSSRDGVRVHRLVREATQADVEQTGPLRDRVIDLVFAATPDATTPDTWESWEHLLPHIVALLDDEQQGETWISLARWHSTYLGSVGSYETAAGYAERAVRQAERVLGPDHPETISSRHNLSISYAQAGRYDDALPVAEQALADRERVLGPDHPETISSRHNLERTRELAAE